MGDRVLGLLPARWPVRWRVAAVAASLTFVILAGFAAAVGRLASDRLRDDFRDELRAAVGELAFALQVQPHSSAPVIVQGPDLEQYAMADHARVRVVLSDGSVVSATPNAPDLGRPNLGVSEIDDLEVATARVFSPRIDLPAVYVQYARDQADVEDTINRLWLFLIAGVLGGSLLSAGGGMMVAGRALRPVTRLTAAAREIGSRRDPSLLLPVPDTDDEVAELARTLDGMLGELDEARSETDAALARQKQFVADASHELRTPLTSVLANLEMLGEAQHEAGAGADDRAAADSALRSAKRMERMVADLLLLARADSARKTARTECDLSSLCADAVVEIGPTATRHRLSCEVEPGISVEGNPDELYRMVSNLLANAVTHTPAETSVKLRARTTGDEAEITVSDNGPGIPPRIRERIFERFVHGQGPADRGGNGGTGLGLAIVCAVALAHGGSVKAIEAPGGGARFVVRLPLVSGAGD